MFSHPCGSDLSSCILWSRCLGSTQNLKSRFGNGYQLEVKLASTKESVLNKENEKLHAFILNHFPSSIILEQFGPRVAYKIAANEVKSLAKTFEILEKGMYRL